jgi:serine/threonine protein kinase
LSNQFLCKFCLARAVELGVCQSCRESAPEHDKFGALPAGHLLSQKYVIESLLGKGGFGITYLASHPALRNKRYAVKELFPSDLVSRAKNKIDVIAFDNSKSASRFETQRTLFLAEALNIDKMHSAGYDLSEVVQIEDHFEANGTAYLVMPFYPGRTLSQRVERDGVLDEVSLLRILRGVLRGLRAVHKAKMVHRDIKPDNVYLDENQFPILIDFGNARIESDAKTSADGYSEGYSAPELAPGVASPKVDMYSLGATVYFCLFGKAPTDSRSRNIGAFLDPDLPALQGKISEELMTFLRLSLSTNPDNRLKDVDEAFSLLKKVLEPEQRWVKFLAPGNFANLMGTVDQAFSTENARKKFWAWEPALLSSIWFFERKSWLIGSVIALAESIAIVFAVVVDSDLWWMVIPLLIVGRIWLGLFGPSLMYRDLAKLVDRAKTANPGQGVTAVKSVIAGISKPSFKFAVLGFVPLVCGLIAYAVSDELNANRFDTVCTAAKASALKVSVFKKDRTVNPEQTELDAMLPSLPDIAKVQMEGMSENFVLTFAAPPGAKDKIGRMEFDVSTNRYRLKSVDLPSKISQKLETERCEIEVGK